MTQEELKILFETIADNNKDTLDALLELSKHVKKYETTDFAKETGFNIYEAYEAYIRSGYLFKQILSTVQKVLDSIDYTTLNNNLSLDTLFEEIPEEYSGVLKEVLSSFVKTEDN